METQSTGSLKASKKQIVLDRLRSFVQAKLLSFKKSIKNSENYNNFWLWNICLLQLVSVLVYFITIQNKYESIAEQIGLNTDNIFGYDQLVKRSFLYLPLIGNLLLVIATLIFTIRAGKKINHLLIICFLNSVIFSILEFIALTKVINYFQ